MFSENTFYELLNAPTDEVKKLFSTVLKSRGSSFESIPSDTEADSYAAFCEKKGVDVVLPKGGRKKSNNSARQVISDLLAQKRSGERLARKDFCFEVLVEYKKRNGVKLDTSNLDAGTRSVAAGHAHNKYSTLVSQEAKRLGIKSDYGYLTIP